MKQNIEFESIRDLESAFKAGGIPFSSITSNQANISLGGVQFFSTLSPAVDLNTVFTKHRKLFLVLTKSPNRNSATSHRNEETRELADRLLFTWQYDDTTSSFVPHRVFTVDRSLLHQTFVREQEETGKSVIGSKLQVTFLHPDLGTIEGKVDTGADQTCLHASNVSISGREVTFTRDKTYKMSASSVAEIQTADRTEKRPNINTKVKVDGFTRTCTIELNLNDRSSMPDELLIGKDLLEQLNCLIDPLIEFSSLDSQTQYNMLCRVLELKESEFNE